MTDGLFIVLTESVKKQGYVYRKRENKGIWQTIRHYLKNEYKANKAYISILRDIVMHVNISTRWEAIKKRVPLIHTNKPFQKEYIYIYIHSEAIVRSDRFFPLSSLMRKDNLLQFWITVPSLAC